VNLNRNQPLVRQSLVVLLRPVERFLRVEASSTVLLLDATAVALVWANLPGSSGYERTWGTPMTLGPGEWLGARELRFWVNDGLMTVFFLVVGLEIRGEL
jgi:NhaA family Na+:H+ antiporter